MWGNSGKETESHFRAQFESDGDRWLFRSGRRGAPIVVTYEEMEESVAVYRQRIQWVTSAGVLVLIIAVISLAVLGSNFLDRDGATWLLVLLWLIPFLAAFMWAWKSPTRNFAQRMPIGPERSRGEARTRMLQEWRWSGIVGQTVGGVILAAYGIANWPPVTIDGWILLSLGVFLVIMGIANAVMKWRTMRSRL